ncbi:MAG: hypothetical protein R3E08_05770 [Thiotrichaceae bacterium]
MSILIGSSEAKEMYQSQLPVKTTDNKLCGMFEQLSPEQQQLVLGMTQELIKINAMQSKIDEILAEWMEIS